MGFVGRRQQLSATFELKNRVAQEYNLFNARGAQMQEDEIKITTMIDELALTDKQVADKFRKQLFTSNYNASLYENTVIPSYE